MARALRIEYPGAIYHVMNRGDRREPIYADDTDRESFIAALGEACAKTNWQVHAWCLMRNHFHLVIETPQPNLVAGMKWLLGTYTGRYNRRHQQVGHLFAGRYKALLVDGGNRGYLRTVAEYVHLNPARAKLLGPNESLRAFPWSSYRFYLKKPRLRPPWLRVDRVLGECGIPRDTPAGRRHFEELLEARRKQSEPEDYLTVRRGWCWGDAQFRKELLGKVGEQMGAHHYGAERRESVEQRAERIIAAELIGRKWRGAVLDQLPMSDPRKVALGLRLRAETTLSVAWIATRLSLGTRQYATKLLYRARRELQQGG